MRENVQYCPHPPWGLSTARKSSGDPAKQLMIDSISSIPFRLIKLISITVHLYWVHWAGFFVGGALIGS